MSGSRLHAAATAAIFLGALLASLFTNGASPIAWSDTFNDEFAVQSCVAGDACAMIGVGTSIPGYYHAVGWLEIRSLLAWMGLTLDGVHVLLQILNALAIAMIFDLATQLGGRPTGIAAVWLSAFSIGSLSVQTAALYNSTPLLFFGAVLVLACTAVVERPGLLSVSLAALIAAVMANIHAACVLAGVSVVWVALCAPHQRFRLTLFAGTTFAMATFLVAPRCWLHNIGRFFEPHEPIGSTSVGLAPNSLALILWALFAVGAWTVSSGLRSSTWVQLRRQSCGAFAVLIPLLAAFLAAPFFGIDANAKYLAHIEAAVAIAAGLPLAAIVSALLRRMTDASEGRRRALRRLETALPFVLALLMPLTITAADTETPTTDDLAATARILQEQRGWSAQHVIDGVKAPQGMTVLSGLRHFVAPLDRSNPATASAEESALLLVLPTNELPHPLPSNWIVLRDTVGSTAVLILTRSRLDWSTFQVCAQRTDGREQTCDTSGLHFVADAPAFGAPKMPSGGPQWHGTLTIRVPMRRIAADAGETIFMPRMSRVCGGVVAPESNSVLDVSSDRRHVRLPPDPTPGSVLTLAWEVGSPDCQSGVYDGLPPFIIAGDQATVELLKAVLDRSEG